MIKDEKVSVKIYSKNCKIYEKKYNCKMKDEIMIDICDIDKYSAKKVQVVKE